MPSKLQPGHLLTREERVALRIAVQDLQRQIDRNTDLLERARLERLLANVEMERVNDKQCRPRKRKPKGGK